jgi:quercetin dioxygenase-like cupin family protein
MRIVGMLALAMAAGAAAAPLPTRTAVGSFAIDPTKPVSHVEMWRVDFLPGQQMPEHMHPVPVVCFVARGTFLVSIGKAAVRTVNVGDATIEPAGEIVHYFRNMSSKEPAQLYCSVLAGVDDKQLSVMLEK